MQSLFHVLEYVQPQPSHRDVYIYLISLFKLELKSTKLLQKLNINPKKSLEKSSSLAYHTVIREVKIAKNKMA